MKSTALKLKFLPAMPKTKLFAIAKNESAYIPQWAYHHLFVGFDEIEVLINNSTDNSAAMCREIANNHNRFKWRNVDSFYQECIRNGLNFQTTIYQKTAVETKEMGIFTHICFLDLDEYLCSTNFNTKLKTLIKDFVKFDAISFLWYSDRPPINAKAFDSFMQSNIALTRGSHVKSIARVKSGIKKVNPHNFNFRKKNRRIKNVLGDGRTILNQDNTERSRQRILAGKVQLHSTEPEQWFILHRIMKSEEEYCTSLLRGNMQSGYDEALKTNRSGYFCASTPQALSIQYSQKDIDLYHEGFNEFIDKSKLNNLLLEAQSFIAQQYTELILQASHRDKLLVDNRKVFQGTAIHNFLE